MRLSDSDLETVEQALALLSGVAPRGWVALDASLAYVGAVKSNSTVKTILHCNADQTTHQGNVELAQAVSTVLNDAGKLLMELRHLRAATRAPRTGGDDGDASSASQGDEGR